MFDLFAQIFSGLSGATAQTTAQATTPPAHSANTLANLFQFDADGGAGWASSAFGEPPEWAPWHPDFDEFAHYGPNGKEGGIGLTPQGLGSAGFPNTMSRGNGQTSQTPPPPSQAPSSTTGGSASSSSYSSSTNDRGESRPTINDVTPLAERNAIPPAPGHDAYVDDAREVNNPNVSETITKATAPTIPDLPERNPIAEDKLPVRGHADDSITYEQATPEQKARIDAARAAASQLGQGPGSPGSHPELPAHQDVNTPPPPELNTNRKLSIPLVKQTLNIPERSQTGVQGSSKLWKTLTSGRARGRIKGWTRYHRGFNSLNQFEKAATIALMEADGGRYEDAKNAAGAMVNRAGKLGEDLGKHVSRQIYQPTIEPAQMRRFNSIVASPNHSKLVTWIQNRVNGLEPDNVKGATHFLAHPRTMLTLYRKNPNKYHNWGPFKNSKGKPGLNWTGYNPKTGTYRGQVFLDRSHAFLKR